MRTLRPMVQPNSSSPCSERHNTGLYFRIVRGQRHEHADAPNPLALLRSRRERPRTAVPPSSVINSRRFN